MKYTSHTSDQIWIHVKYVGHVAVMSGRTKETIGLPKNGTAVALLQALEDKYPGFRDIFMPPDGVFNSRTGMVCRRPGVAGFGIVNPQEQLRDGDVLTLW